MIEVFSELFITGSARALDQFVECATRFLSGGWSRDNEAEARIRTGASLSDRPTYVFAKALAKEPSRALLFLVRDPHRLAATNIVPQGGGGRLSRNEYNRILSEFSATVARPTAELLGLEVTQTDEKRDISYWLSDAAVNALQLFSLSANKSTGSSHPSDFALWTRFLFQAHRDQSRLDAGTLERWLIEEQNWSPDVASDLGDEYSFSRSLLSLYDANG